MSSVVSHTQSRTKRTRGGVQPAPLTRGDILRAALPLLARHGVDGLTVQSVAVELGISSPAVYYHFSGRDDLVDRLCESVAAEVELDVDPMMGWDDAVVAVLLSMDRTFARYPGVAARVVPAHQHSPAASRIAETVHQLVVGGGYGADRARQLVDALRCLFGGWLLDEHPAHDGTVPLERAARWLMDGFATNP